MTWRLLRPGAWFGEELIKFVEEYVPRMSLSKAFHCQLGIFRLWPTNEATVEEKHARLALAAISRRLGAVRISLTNRLIMMEHMLSMGWVKVTEIIHFFDEARRLTQCPQMFGLEAHPSLAELHYPHPVLLRKLFARVVYRTDLSSVFQNVRAIGKRNENRKKKQGRDIARLLGAVLGTVTSYDGVMREAMLAHFKELIQVSESGVLSVPPDCLAMRNFAVAMDDPGLPPVPPPNVVCLGEDNQILQSDVDDGLGERQQMLLFVRYINLPGYKKRIHTMPGGGGGSIRQHEIAVRVHAPEISQSTGAPIVDGCLDSDDYSGHIYLISDLAGDLNKIKEETKELQFAESQWFLKDVCVFHQNLAMSFKLSLH